MLWIHVGLILMAVIIVNSFDIFMVDYAVVMEMQ